MVLAQFELPTLLLAVIGSEVATWVAISVAVFILLMGKGRKLTKCGDAAKCGTATKCGGGILGKAFGVIALLVAASIAVTFFARSSAHVVVEDIPQVPVIPPLPSMPQPPALPEMAPYKTVEEAWNAINKPRIDLKADAKAETTVALNGPRVEMRVDEHRVQMSVEQATDSNSASLAKSLERLERVSEQVSRVADQVSDVGTMVGKALVAINGSLKSESATEVAVKAAVPVALAAAAPQPTAETAEAESKDITIETPPPAVRPPAWIDDPPKRVGDVWREVIVTDEFATAEESQRQADELLMQAVANYMRQFAGDTVAPVMVRPSYNREPIKRFVTLEEMGIGIDFVRHEIATAEYMESVQRSFGPMLKSYTEVQFSPSLQQELRRRWEEYMRRERFATVGLGAGSVLGLIGFVYGLLKVDTWTKGYYSKRLFLGVPAAIIGGFGLLVLFLETIGGH